MTTWYRKLQALGACSEAVEYAKTHTSFASAWRACDRGDWMLWILGTIGTERKKLVMATVACAQPVLRYTKDRRVKACLDTVSKWCRDKATIEQVIEARYAAADAADAAACAAADAADAAACAAADATACTSCTSCGAYAAADAAADATSAASASDAARKKSLKRSAAIVRKIFPLPSLGK